MKMAPISGDLLLKLALGGVALIVLYGLARKAGTAAYDAASSAAWAVSPTNGNNVIYQGANAATGGGQDTTLGIRFYNFLHPNQYDPYNF